MFKNTHRPIKRRFGELPFDFNSGGCTAVEKFNPHLYIGFGDDRNMRQVYAASNLLDNEPFMEINQSIYNHTDIRIASSESK